MPDIFPEELRDAALVVSIARQKCVDLMNSPNPDPALRLIAERIAEDARLDARIRFDKELEKYMANVKRVAS